MKAVQSAAVGGRLLQNRRLRAQLLLFSGIILVYLIFNGVLDGRLLTATNLRIILSHAVFPALVAWGMSFFFSTGIIDLSVGSNIILSANVGCYLATRLNLGMPGLIVGTILTCMLLQHLNIRAIIDLEIPSWIAGLGAALVYEAITAQYMFTQNIMALDLPNKYRPLGNMPYLGIVYFAAFAVAYFLSNRTTVGLNIKALGGNQQVAGSMGIDRKKTVIIGALIGAAFIGMGAVIQISYAGRVYATTGLGSLASIFQALACVLLSGSIASILSPPVGILVSSFFVVSIFNVLTMLGVPSGTGQDIFLGVIVVVCGILSHLRHKGVVK